MEEEAWRRRVNHHIREPPPQLAPQPSLPLAAAAASRGSAPAFCLHILAHGNRFQGGVEAPGTDRLCRSGAGRPSEQRRAGLAQGFGRTYSG